MVIGRCLGVLEQGRQLSVARLKIKIIDNFPAIMKTLPISLSEEITTYLQTQVESGHYATPSDYIQALIQEDQTRKSRLENLALVGIKSGSSTPMTSDDWSHIRATVHRNINQSN
jgi:antitoxin ParD1/3/4